MSAEPLKSPQKNHSESSCPDSGAEESDIEDGVSHRHFSDLSSERTSASRPLLVRVQKHWQLAMVSSSAVDAEATASAH